MFHDDGLVVPVLSALAEVEIDPECDGRPESEAAVVAVTVAELLCNGLVEPIGDRL